MNKKNNKRYKQNSQKIEDTFLALIQNNSYENITISQICQEACVNRSTFYAHYDDINDLIIKIESKFALSMSLIFDHGMRQEHQAFIEMFSFIEKNKAFYKAFLNISQVTFAEKNIQKNILSNIKNSSNNFNYNEIEITYRAHFFGAGIKAICKLWLDRDCKESPKQMAEIIVKEYIKR
ncbi:MAG: TetR/AcrR family transcriptional regulator [Anaeroplasmataceae bacterium]